MRKTVPEILYLASDVFLIAFYKTFKKNVEYIQEKLGSYSKTKAGVVNPIGNPGGIEKTPVPVFLRNAGITAYMIIHYFDEPEQLFLSAGFFFDKHDRVWMVIHRDDQKNQKKPLEKVTEGCARTRIEHIDWYLKRIKKFMKSGSFDRRTFPNKMNEDFVRSKIKKDELLLKKKLEEHSVLYVDSK